MAVTNDKEFLNEYNRLSDVPDDRWSPDDQQDWHNVEQFAVFRLYEILAEIEGETK